MITAKKNRLFNRIFSVYSRRLIRAHFYRVHIDGEENLLKIDPALPAILYANHSNWWDGFVAYYLTSILWKREDYFMMEIEQMKKYKMFRYLGVFSIDRNNPAEVMKTLNYASGLLKNTNRFMWIFPQGKMEVQDKRPIEFYSGIAKLAEKTGSVNLLPAAFRYEFIMEQRPEIFIKLGTPDIINSAGDIKNDLTNTLKNKLTGELDELKQMVLNGEFDKFRIIFKGKESRNKTIDRMKAN